MKYLVYQFQPKFLVYLMKCLCPETLGRIRQLMIRPLKNLRWSFITTSNNFQVQVMRSNKLVLSIKNNLTMNISRSLFYRDRFFCCPYCLSELDEFIHISFIVRINYFSL